MSKSVKYFWIIFWSCIGSVGLFITMANIGWLGEMPSIDDIQNPSASLSSQVYAEDNTLMGKYYLEDRVNVEYQDISKDVIHALVATEDERFYDHSGIDFRSLLRAFKGLGRNGGASTITMQTAKNLFTQYKRNAFRRMIQKLKEAIIAIKLEQHFTKDEIITLYLNTVPFGDNVFGIRNASKTFFQKEPAVLNVEEAAVLIGMLKGSTLYNPRIYPKKSRERRNTVLDQMVRNNFLSESEATRLKAKPIEINFKKMDETAGLAPYFRMILGEEMKKWCKEHRKQNGENYDLYRDGLKIFTTINPRMQVYAEEAVAKHISYMQKILNKQSNIKDGTIWNGFENVIDAGIRQSDRYHKLKSLGYSQEKIMKSFKTPVRMKIFAWNNKRITDTIMTPYDSVKYMKQMLQSGFMAMDPQSGEVLAWVGGIDFKNFKYDHVNFNTKRQVGSTIKPLLYSLAIEELGMNPNSPVIDEQQDFGEYGLVPATTKSCSGASMPMINALTFSKNCATAYIMKQLESKEVTAAQRFVKFLKEKCGLKTDIKPNPSIAIGACEISLYEMMQAYTMLPGRGFNVKPIYITRIEDRNGNIIESNSPERREVISDKAAYLVIKMMQSVMQNGTGRAMGNYCSVNEMAGKTGTTNDNSDAWFMGYTPQILCGTWVGCDDRFIRLNSTELGQGSRAAMPIWGYFFDKISKDPQITSINPEAIFAKPEVDVNDINNDFIKGSGTQNADESENMGNGTSSDYDVDPNIKPENLNGESSLPPSETNNSPEPTNPKSNTTQEQNKKGTGKNKGTTSPKSPKPSNEDNGYH